MYAYTDYVLDPDQVLEDWAHRAIAACGGDKSRMVALLIRLVREQRICEDCEDIIRDKNTEPKEAKRCATPMSPGYYRAMWKQKPHGIFYRGISVGYFNGKTLFYVVGSESVWCTDNFAWFEGPLTFEGAKQTETKQRSGGFSEEYLKGMVKQFTHTPCDRNKIARQVLEHGNRYYVFKFLCLLPTKMMRNCFVGMIEQSDVNKGNNMRLVGWGKTMCRVFDPLSPYLVEQLLYHIQEMEEGTSDSEPERVSKSQPPPEPKEKKPAGPSLPSLASLNTLRGEQIAKEEEAMRRKFEEKRTETIKEIERVAKNGQRSLYCGYHMGPLDRQQLCDWINEHEGYTARCGDHPYESYSNVIEVWIGKKPSEPKPKPEPKPVKVTSKWSWVPFFLRWK